ncbi:MAG: putative siderophore transport system ATP-binding protein YusV [Bacteroidetes bacterium ADurb.Bin416]|nr:MAG: putative siderophore transport system ATP-binding protein YusV [Bacteroidetes bacterium ADurb.Bin416]
MITANSLSIGYRKGTMRRDVQQNLNLKASKGELIAILGPNGCGKSTLLRTLAGLQPVLAGSVTIDGSLLSSLSPAARATRISLVLTDPVQVIYLTVRSLVAMGRHPYTTLTGRLSAADHQAVDNALRAVRMEAFADRYIQELSDGERQRVMIAKALAQDTPLVFLDEPTSHLDLPNRVETMLLLRKLVVELGKTILLSTHEIDLALRLADRIWLMQPEGGMVEGTPETLMQQGKIQAVFKSDGFGFEAETGRVIIF